MTEFDSGRKLKEATERLHVAAAVYARFTTTQNLEALGAAAVEYDRAMKADKEAYAAMLANEDMLF